MYNYLILTKDSAADVKRWGLPSEQLGCFVDDSGIISPILKWDSFPRGKGRLLLVNMLVQMPMDHHSDCCKAIARLIGKAPRIWVHFGELNSNDATSAIVAARWQDGKYAGFRKLSDALMPYSAHSGEAWDTTLAKLCHAFKTATAQQGQRKIAKLGEYLKELDDVWQAASKKCPPVKTHAAGKQKRKEYILQSLMPVFVYLDGLLYAHTCARDKEPAMTELVINALADVLPAVQISGPNSFPREIRDQIHLLQAGMTRDNAVAKSRAFCTWYRAFARRVIEPDPPSRKSLKRVPG